MTTWIIWIALVAYAVYFCKGVAKRLKMSEAVAIVGSLLMPILTLLIYGHLNYKANQKDKAQQSNATN